MAKKFSLLDKSPTKLGFPKASNPYKEMQWCLAKSIKVFLEPETRKITANEYQMTGNYRVVIEQGARSPRRTDYIYDRNNICDAVNDTYVKIYNLNYGKEKEV